MITSLADALVLKGDTARAKEVLDFGMERMPVEAVPYDVSSIGFVQGYFDVGEKELAAKMAMELAEQFNSELSYLQNKQRWGDYNFSNKLRGLRYLQLVLQEEGKNDEAKRVEEMLNEQNIRLNIDRSNF